MREKIDCFLPCSDFQAVAPIIAQLRASKTIQNICLLTSDPLPKKAHSDWQQLQVDNLSSSNTLMSIAENAKADYVLLQTKPTQLILGEGALDRLLRIASDADAAMAYADHYDLIEGERREHPVIDYQLGSIRDDFDFGSLILIKTSLLHTLAMQAGEHDYQYAGLYDLRLFLSRNGQLFHINEKLYTEEEQDTRASGVKQFDYVNPRNREVQIEMEQVATAHLAEIGAKIYPSYYRRPDFNEQEFDVEASVIIPVYNREKTICDAVNSALSQKTSFKYNVIVVDNHSTDKTTELLKSFHDDRLVHIIPDRTDLGIGGCWNKAIHDDRCGRFAVQLDSDDLYSSPKTLQQVVDTFYKQNAAMVIGSYRMCDFDLNTLMPCASTAWVRHAHSSPLYCDRSVSRIPAMVRIMPWDLSSHVITALVASSQSYTSADVGEATAMQPSLLTRPMPTTAIRISCVHSRFSPVSRCCRANRT